MDGRFSSPAAGWVTSAPRNMTGSRNTGSLLNEANGKCGVRSSSVLFAATSCFLGASQNSCLSFCEILHNIGRKVTQIGSNFFEKIKFIAYCQ